MSELVGDARTWSPDVQEAVRLLAVSALVEGRDQVEVAALFKVSVKAVDSWWAKWRAGGRDALLSRPRGRRVGEHQVLSEAEQAALDRAGLAECSWILGDVGTAVAQTHRAVEVAELTQSTQVRAKLGQLYPYTVGRSASAPVREARHRIRELLSTC